MARLAFSGRQRIPAHEEPHRVVLHGLLTRTVQRRILRDRWESRLRNKLDGDAPALSPAPLEDLAARSQRELIARGWSAP